MVGVGLIGVAFSMLAGGTFVLAARSLIYGINHTRKEYSRMLSLAFSTALVDVPDLSAFFRSFLLLLNLFFKFSKSCLALSPKVKSNNTVGVEHLH